MPPRRQTRHRPSGLSGNAHVSWNSRHFSSPFVALRAYLALKVALMHVYLSIHRSADRRKYQSVQMQFRVSQFYIRNYYVSVFSGYKTGLQF